MNASLTQSPGSGERSRGPRLPSILAPLLLTGGALVWSSGVFAAEGEDLISTDRPDFVESSLTVGAGRAQIETSLGYERNEGFHHSPHEWATPTLLRVGLGDSWEARLETEGWVSLRGEGDNQSGMSELALGAKYHIAPAGPWGASSALLMHVDLPTGDPAFQGRGARPSLRWTAEWEVGERGSLGVMPGLIWNTDDEGDRYLGELFGITYAYAWTGRFRSFAEFAADGLGGDDGSQKQLTLDTGVAWVVTPDVQIDAASYIGLNDNAPDVALTLGLSCRW